MESQLCGVFANRTHEIIPIHKCLLQNERTEEVAKFIFDFIVKNKISIYDEKTGKGLIRHIVTKIGINTNEIMCVIVINGRQIQKEKELVTEILSHFPEVRTIIKNSNMKNTNVILGQENVTLHGSGYIQDKLGEYCFKISPLSFYQVNPMQAEKLYLKGVEAANISKKDVVFDLYCGIGTISLFMSSYVEFIAGDVEEAFDDLLHNRKIIPDIVMVDPPRKGLDDKTVENILAMRPKRLVYISCNPATLVRDLAKMEELYTIKRIEPVDMFPFTSHAECVAVLQLKEDMIRQ